MTNAEKKAYIKSIDKAYLVKELVLGVDMSVEAAVDYVYDHLTLSNEEFIAKYF